MHIVVVFLENLESQNWGLGAGDEAGSTCEIGP